MIYGADATGGVVNFITRDDFVGLEINAQYKSIDGSDGDYSAGILGGIGDGRVNFLWSAEWEHRSRLHAVDRDFTRDSFDPTQAWLQPRAVVDADQPRRLAAARRAARSAERHGEREFGTPVGGIVSDFTPQSCAAVGGRYDNNFTCAYNYIPYYNLVEDNDIYRGFAQLNADDHRQHAVPCRGVLRAGEVAAVFGSPAQPVIRGPAMATGATLPVLRADHQPLCRGLRGAQRHRRRVGLHAGDLPAARARRQPGVRRGNGFGVPDKIDNQIWRVSAGSNGKLRATGPGRTGRRL